VAAALQHEKAAQRSGRKAAGARVDPPTATRLRSAPPASGHGRTNIDSGTANGGRSLCVVETSLSWCAPPAPLPS